MTMIPILRNLKAAVVAAAVLPVFAAEAQVRIYTPESPGEFTYIKDATPSSLKAAAKSGKKPLAETAEPLDDSIAFTNFAYHAGAVAFEKMPMENILPSWKSLGIKVLKTVRYRPEVSAEYFRREAGFQAFQQGADAIWVPDSASLPPVYSQALEEAKEDWKVLLYLRDLAAKAEANPDNLIKTEFRRVSYWFGYMPATWENLDTLRLETVAWARRLEQILGLPRATLPDKQSSRILPESSKYKPFADFAGVPADFELPKNWQGKTFDLGDGLSFRADYIGFTLTFNTPKGPKLEKGQNPGGRLNFHLYIQGTNRTDYLPYRLLCDLDDWWKGPRAPARGRSSYLFGTDERFKPYSLAYENTNTRVYTWPRLRSYGRGYPDLRPRMTLTPNENGGYKVSVEVRWVSLYGFWPTLEDNKKDIWYVGLERSPETGKPAAFRIIWPKGFSGAFQKFAEKMSLTEITRIYKEELDRTKEVWATASRERYYGFKKTKEPCYNRYDLESDTFFQENLLQPVLDANENAWQLIWSDKEHQHPKFPKQNDTIKMMIWKKLGLMLYMSYDVGLLRRDYLSARFAGKEIKKYVKKEDKSRASATIEPDADFDSEAIQLDDLEF